MDQPRNNASDKADRSIPTQFRHAVILPDGSKPVPLGSGSITALLGEGGMANVYEIWNAQLEVNRAVKLLHPNCSSESKERFQTEIKITAKLHHPNIIEIHGVGEWNSLPFIEMEKIEGYTLENLVADRGALPVAVCTAVGIMISRALDYAHNQQYVIYGIKYNGVIHRDLKPSNIMVCTNGAVKLMDFGIARPTDASIHTTDGTILGTMQYLSPEQLDGIEPDVRTDIYSLGTTLYEALTGVQAFPERNMSKLMMNKIKNEFKPLDNFRVRIPVRLKRLIHKCMIHDRDKRIASASVLLSELEKIHKSITDQTPEQTIHHFIATKASERMIITSRRRFPLRAALAFAAALVVLALVGYGSFQWREQQSRNLAENESMPQLTIASADQTDPRAADTPSNAPQKSSLDRDRKRSTTGSAAAAPAMSARKAPPAVPGSSKRTSSSEPRSLYEKLTEEHGTDDRLALMEAEMRRKSPKNVLELAKELPADQTTSKNALILQLRALDALGDKQKLNAFLQSHTIQDGEFLLAQARLAFEQKRFKEAQSLLSQALRSPREFIDSEKLRRKVYFYQARCATAVFDQSPSEENYRKAIEAWYQVATEVRNTPDHAYNATARTERQRIAEKYRNSRG